jgi:hypothetical protein
MADRDQAQVQPARACRGAFLTARSQTCTQPSSLALSSARPRVIGPAQTTRETRWDALEALRAEYRELSRSHPDYKRLDRTELVALRDGATSKPTANSSVAPGRRSSGTPCSVARLRACLTTSTYLSSRRSQPEPPNQAESDGPGNRLETAWKPRRCRKSPSPAIGEGVKSQPTSGADRPPSAGVGFSPALEGRNPDAEPRSRPAWHGGRPPPPRGNRSLWVPPEAPPSTHRNPGGQLSESPTQASP